MTNNRLSHFFKSFKKALLQNSESNFRGLWHPESYTTNLTGNSGLSGDAVFTQAINGQWTLYPDMESLEILEDPIAYLIGCRLEDWNKTKETATKDYVYVLIGQDEASQNLWLLGAAEEKEEVLQLWKRLSENQKAPSDHPLDEEDTTPSNILPLLSTEDAALKLIEELNTALREGNEQSFASLWLLRAYQHNLAGKGGLPGYEFFTQLFDSKLEIKALLEYATLFDQPEGILIPINLWISQLNLVKTNDERLLLLVNISGTLKALGVGTSLTEMRHLYLSHKGDFVV